ncbi:MAG: DUF86 domain-containing protein [Bacteroidales bacterium]|nr:DUF86 domain-containing protein [Bacteroidales bacterium]
MREPIKDLGRITHMLEMAEMLNSEKELCSLDRIKAEKLYFYGLSKMVEIIGEAAYMITKEYKHAHPQIPWRQIEGMRPILVHGYYTVSPEVLYDVVQNDIPLLIPMLRKYREEFEL